MRTHKGIRRRLLTLLPIVSAAWVGMWGCGGEEVARTVTVYSPHGKEILRDFEERFESAYPEIDVRPLYLSSQTILERLDQERVSPICDVWWGAPSSMFQKAAAEMLLDEYVPSWHIGAATGTFDEDSRRWFGTFLSPEVLFFNKNTVSREEAPKDWDDLLDPKWKGKILLRYPMESGTMRSIFSAMIWRTIIDPKELDPTQGYGWLRRLDANVKAYPTTPERLFDDMTRSREPVVSMWLLSDIEMQRNRYGRPFDYVVPPKTPILVEGIALVNQGLDDGDQRKEDAKLFYEFVTSKESLLRMAQDDYYRIPARTDLPKERLPDWIKAHDWQELAMEIDWEVVSRHQSSWMRDWQDEIYQQGRESS